MAESVQDPPAPVCTKGRKRGRLAHMPERPDFATLTRGQIAVLDRLNSGETGLPVLNHIVRLAQDALGGRGAGFAEYSPDHGRVVAATGDCAHALGRRVEREDPRRPGPATPPPADRARGRGRGVGPEPTRLSGRPTLLIPLNSLNDEFASQIEGGN